MGNIAIETICEEVSKIYSYPSLATIYTNEPVWYLQKV